MQARQLYLFSQQAPQKRKTAVAQTSIIAYHEEKAKGTFQNLQQKIFFLLASGATMTRRQLAKTLKKEPSSLCAALSKLEKKALIEVGFYGKCPKTGKQVSWFRLCKNSIIESLTNNIH